MRPLITSSQNQHIKTAQRLRDRRGRDRLGRIVIDGAREIRRAIEAGVNLEMLFLADGISPSADARTVVQLAEAVGTMLLPVTQPMFDKIAYGDRAEGVLAVAVPPSCDLTRLDPHIQTRLVVLEGVEKPGNIGAVLRSADAAGMSALIVADPATDVFNPNAIRASLGTIFSLPVASAGSDLAHRWLVDRGFRIFAARVDGSIDYAHVSYEEPFALVLGSEATGLSDAWRGEAVTPVSLPMMGTADSLNVAAAAAVLCYEALRQRRGDA